ncbi:MAG: c-type cytochrome [Planctomycetota bacterium]
MRWIPGMLLVLGLVGALASCGGGDPRLERWEGVDTATVLAQAPLEEAGFVAFKRRQCALCHGPNDSAVAPSHYGLYGSTVQLDDGTTVVADAAYLRESILYADRKIVAGYRKSMANYAGVIPTREVDAIVAYIKTLEASP